jgi:hypothetical protein
MVQARCGSRYIVYGEDRRGLLHEITRTDTATAARQWREAKSRPWVRLVVHGAMGELSIARLERMVDSEGGRLATLSSLWA